MRGSEKKGLFNCQKAGDSVQLRQEKLFYERDITMVAGMKSDGWRDMGGSARNRRPAEGNRPDSQGTFKRD
jgi:hypothetical protein